MVNWIPRRLFSADQEAREREDIVARSINLINDDPNAAGIIDTFATTIIGAGLRPNPTLNFDVLGITRDQSKDLETRQKLIYKIWAMSADSGGRMTDGEIQHLKCRCLFGMGESLELIHMRDSYRPYYLTSQVINPLRLKTPTDKKSNTDIRQGVEINKYGEPVAYWIKKAGKNNEFLGDNSENFVRIPARNGHRWLVLHDFITKDPEQFRGYPLLSPAIRFFRDLSDLLGAELASNVVTAALSIFVETNNPYGTANNALPTNYGNPATKEDRRQEIAPGEIWYGTSGQKPHLLSADRPGNTFDPFTKLIKKSMSMPTGIPYPVLFKDIDGVSFAGFRSAMLEAWRVYDYHRRRIGQKDCQKKYTMLMEEAYLRGELKIPQFYTRMHIATSAEWFGAPKGDIEPYKAFKTDMMKFQAGAKSMEKIIIEDGGAGFLETIGQIEEERNVMMDKGILMTKPQDPETAPLETENGQ